jgi:predicted transcriptional regulator
MLYKAGGIPEPAIAVILGISQNTLRKYFAPELETGRGVKRAQNLKRLEKAADKQNVTAMKALHVLFDKGEAADLLADPDFDVVQQDQQREKQKEKVRTRVTKKEVQHDEALNAGLNSEWGEDLAPLAGTKPN